MSRIRDVDPIFMGSSDVVVQNEGYDGCNKCLDVSEFSVAASNRELVNLENAAVNIDNSNDVIIGPVTQFNVNGNVTIFQNRDCVEEKDIKTPTCNGNQNESTHKRNLKAVVKYLTELYHKRKKDLTKIMFCIILSACAMMLYFTISLNNNLTEVVQPKYGRYLGNYSLYYISDWGGIVVPNEKLFLPFGVVIVSHTETEFCSSFKECAKILKALQIYQMRSLGYHDICYNFLIGGNGNIYLGRGWDSRNCYKPELSIAISFIGNFHYDHLTSSMKSSFKLLLNQGLDLFKLSKNFWLIGFNQTVFSDNPGNNVYEFIKTLPNFSDIDLSPEYDENC